MAPTTLAPQHSTSFQPDTLAQFLNSLATQAPYEAPYVPPITPAQKMEIQGLAAHPLLSRPEKTRVLLAYYRWDTEQAAEAIKKLQSVCAALDDMRAAV